MDQVHVISNLTTGLTFVTLPVKKCDFITFAPWISREAIILQILAAN